MLSDDELEILNKKYKLSGCKTLRQFIMKCLFEKDIFPARRAVGDIVP